MQEYDVRIFPAAQRDGLSIAGHLSALEPDDALSYYEDLMERVNILKTSPQSCPIAKNAQLRYRGYRTLAVNDFVFFFIINGNKVEIRRIIHSKRQFENLT